MTGPTHLFVSVANPAIIDHLDSDFDAVIGGTSAYCCS